MLPSALLLTFAALSTGTAPTATEADSLAAMLRAGTEALPIAFAVDALTHLRVTYHQIPPRPLALLVPAEEAAAGSSENGKGVDAGPSMLTLHGPTFRPEERHLGLRELPLDATTALFEILITVYLNPPPGNATAAPVEGLDDRAAALLPEVPEASQREAYVEAAAAFGAHALAVANQLRRSAEHHRRQGSDLCRHLDNPRGLFVLWDAIFADPPAGGTRYGARYYQRPEDGRGRWVETGVVLGGADKAWLAEQLFDGVWRGDRRLDLAARLCSTSPADAPATADAPAASSP